MKIKHESHGVDTRTCNCVAILNTRTLRPSPLCFLLTRTVDISIRITQDRKHPHLGHPWLETLSFGLPLAINTSKWAITGHKHHF